MSDDSYLSRQARMDREYLAAGGDAPNHSHEFPKKFQGPVRDLGSKAPCHSEGTYGNFARTPLVDDEPEAASANLEPRDGAETLHRMLLVAWAGKRAGMPIRIAALECIAGLLTIREAAKKAGCGIATMHDAVRKTERLLSEVNSA